ncbi:serine/threonine protein kinase [Rubritalea tangerina]|uniref:Protein kinase n=1 Tax=Rubritalea tangerina TaxID=430798 RepID=A0ABW4ZFI5_9BACT
MSQGFTPPTPEELNPYFDGFEVTDFIAQGGMGAVFRATQISLERPVAIKILPYELGLDPQFSSSFETEAKAMAKLNHPNLVQVFDFGNINGMLYIVMELVPGRSLFDSAHGKSVEMSEACRLIAAMCRGLEHAHQSGLIHRDIKPANVLIDDQARPKIVDFGLARPLDNTHEGGTIYGTKGYTAPEVLNDPNNIDQRADIFSVGVMLYELLTGTMPPHPYIPASTISDSDPEFDTIILKAMHPQREFRYPNAGEMAEELETLAQKLEDKANQTGGLAGRPAAIATTQKTASLPSRPIQVKQPSSAPIAAIVIISLLVIGGLIGFSVISSNKAEEEEANRLAQIEEQKRIEQEEANAKQASLKAQLLRERKEKEDRLAELERERRILEEDRRIAEEDRLAELEEQKIKEQEDAKKLADMRAAAEAERAAIEAEKAALASKFDHLKFIAEMRTLIAKNTGDTISEYDASLLKNIERFIREGKRAVRRLDRSERRAAELEAETFYEEVLSAGRLPSDINKAPGALKKPLREYALEQREIDKEYAPQLKLWRETYVGNCKLKCDTLDEVANEESILYINKEIELTEDEWQRILIIAKGGTPVEPEIEEAPKDKEKKKTAQNSRRAKT